MIIKNLKEKKRERTKKWLQFRIRLTMILFLLFFALIMIRVSKLMLINRDELYNQAERQHKVVFTYVTKRGNIYDTNDIDLAVSVEMDSIYACPPEIKDIEETADLLCDIISMDRSKLTEKLKSKKN